ncbi:hypothetical protein Pla52n_68900 [Stieleria varia]|uniref:Uncharacterized protein n=1 Tax=Stieleria varia TaxID=2528005 RepID=A0A5C5ZQD7_9BACT|nr:hypothetical protein Pla52n_68900 [Stieleria varia]
MLGNCTIAKDGKRFKCYPADLSWSQPYRSAVQRLAVKAPANTQFNGCCAPFAFSKPSAMMRTLTLNFSSPLSPPFPPPSVKKNDHQTATYFNAINADGLFSLPYSVKRRALEAQSFSPGYL